VKRLGQGEPLLKRATAAALLAMLCLLPAASAAQPKLETPIPSRPAAVIDLGEQLSPAAERALNALSLELKQKTGAELAVLTVPTTAPLDAFAYGLKVSDAWKLGSAEKDEGLLLLMAVEQRQLRFFTGYGLEGLLPDGRLGEILDRYAMPNIRAGKVDAGIYSAALAAAQLIATDAGVALSGQAAATPASHSRRRGFNPFSLVWIFFMLPGMFGRRRRRGLMYLPFLFGGGSGMGGFGGGLGGLGGGGGFGGGGAGRGW